MKKLCLIAMLLAAGFGAVAQTDKTPTREASDDAVFMVVETDPEFNGGMEGLYEWMSSNVEYPQEAKEKNIQGVVYVTFVIEKDGSVSGVRVVRSPDPMLSAEAERVVKTMPKWKPGMQRNKKVRVQYTLPINFKL